MRVGTLRLLALATAVAGVTTLAVAQSPPDPPPSPYPAPGLPPGLPKDFPRDPLGNLFPLPLPIPDAETRALMLEGADKLMRAIERMIQTMPVYDPPVMTPEGDIILRRRNPAPEPVPRRAPPPQAPAPSPWPNFPPPPGSTPPGPPIDRTTI